MLIGGFLRQSKPIFSDGVPDTFHYSVLPDNWDDFREFMIIAIASSSNGSSDHRLDFEQCDQTIFLFSAKVNMKH